MKKSSILSVLAFALVLALGNPAQAVYGVPDVVPAGTLVVPMAEANPSGSEDTLIVVNNVSPGSVLLHFEFWDVNGTRIPDLAFNTTLTAHDVFPLGTASFLAGASPGVKTQLTDFDGFYRGFVTIDHVTMAPTVPPGDENYPLADANVLEGWIYYVRLFDGSSNGMPAIHIEATGAGVASGTNDRLDGFYREDDPREEIDEYARLCITDLATGAASPCSSGDDSVGVDARIFTEAALSGTTRIILFAWNTVGNTPAPNGNASFVRYDESGNNVESGNLPLNRVVSVFTIAGGPNGWLTMQAPVDDDAELFSFTFNSANPDPSRNWDAIFVNPITP